MSNCSSFLRQLNIYNFQRSKSGNEFKFHHPLFNRGRPEDLHLIRRRKKKVLNNENNKNFDLLDFNIRTIKKDLLDYEEKFNKLLNEVKLYREENARLNFQIQEHQNQLEEEDLTSLLLIVYRLSKNPSSEAAVSIKSAFGVNDENLKDKYFSSHCNDLSITNTIITESPKTENILNSEMIRRLRDIAKSTHLSSNDEFRTKSNAIQFSTANKINLSSRFGSLTRFITNQSKDCNISLKSNYYLEYKDSSTVSMLLSPISQDLLSDNASVFNLNYYMNYSEKVSTHKN